MSNFTKSINLDIRIANSNFSGYANNLKIKGLRISIQAVKTLSWSTNTANIQIYNLSPENRAKLNSYGDEISIYAGKDKDSPSPLMFIGDSTKVTHVFNFPDVVTSLQCGDGEKILNQKLISVSFASKVSAKTVVQDIASKMGVTIAFFANTLPLEYENGFQFVGFAKDGLDKVCNYLNLTWSIQNNQLVMIENNGSTRKTPVAINVSTGMIGVPERYTYKRLDLWTAGPKQGYKVKTLLRTDILPGDKIQLSSKKIGINGLFFVESIRHLADNIENTWESNLEVVAL